MDPVEVLSLLNEPREVSVTAVNTHWLFGDRAHVVFDTRTMKVERWRPPDSDSPRVPTGTVILDALKLSILAAGLATVVVACLGGLTGWCLARYRFPGHAIVDSLLNLPLVLPPTVTGYYLIVLLGRRGVLGGPLHEWSGWSVPFTWVACVIAASVMALPLMVRAARVAFEELDRRHELISATLGRGAWSTFVHVSVPLARRGLMGGVILAFARALGEFGATLMLAGNIPGRTQTLPLAIYEAVMAGEDRAALLLSAILTAVSVVVILVAGRLGRRSR